MLLAVVWALRDHRAVEQRAAFCDDELAHVTTRSGDLSFEQDLQDGVWAACRGQRDRALRKA